jgi:hypothetical protein
MPMSPRLLRPTASRSGIGFDADAATYIRAVEAADGQALEPVVGVAINNFVVGCKADGIWSAIKASCLLMGARTLSGALTPLVGAAPTNNNFVSADYNRKTGLIGNGSTKSLNSNRNNNADPQDNFHAAVWVQTADANSGRAYFGAGAATNEAGATNFGRGSGGGLFFRCRGGLTQPSANPTGLIGVSRSASASYLYRAALTNTTVTATSEIPFSANLFVFSATNSAFPTSARMTFYSIGESLNLALLDSRLATLNTAIGAAIP